MKLPQNQKVGLEVDLPKVSAEMTLVIEETIQVVKEVIQDVKEVIQGAREVIQEAKEVMTLDQAEKNLLRDPDVADASLYFKKNWPIKKVESLIKYWSKLQPFFLF